MRTIKCITNQTVYGFMDKACNSGRFYDRSPMNWSCQVTYNIKHKININYY